MYRAAVLYRGIWLAPGSDCYRLHQEGKLRELQAVLARLGLEELERQSRG